jgi:hypothetical protein
MVDSVGNIVDANININNPAVDIKSSFALASAPASRVSMAPADMKYTAFTAELVDVLQNGIDIPDTYLNMACIYDAVRERIRQKKNLRIHANEFFMRATNSPWRKIAFGRWIDNLRHFVV